MPVGPVAVTGATGWIGGRVVEGLVAAGVEVVALARDPARVTAPVASRRCEYDDRASLRAALAGVGTLVLVSSDGEADTVLRQHLAVVEAAAKAGVGRVANLSGVDADPASPFCFGRTNGATEAALAAAIPDVRVVRAGLFADFLRALLGDAEEVRLPDAAGSCATESLCGAQPSESACPAPHKRLYGQRGQRVISPRHPRRWRIAPIQSAVRQLSRKTRP